MKYILILTCCLFLAASAKLSAQRVDYVYGVAYSTQDPSAFPRTNRPWQVWKNTATGVLWNFDRTQGKWIPDNLVYYGEMGIEADTLTNAYAAAAEDTIRGFTAGLLSGFALDGDFALRYTGTTPNTFLLTYSTTVTFAEAATLTMYVKQNTSIVYKSRQRQIVATAGNNVNVSGNCLLTLSPGDRIALFLFPTSHSGSDDLTVYEANIALTQVK